MPLFSPPNLTSGIDDAITTTAQSVPMFPIMILVFVFLVVVLGGTANQKRRTGNADYPFWFVLGGMTITMIALLFSLGGGLVNLVTLGIVIALTIMFGLWFFLSKVRGEQ